MLHRPGAGAGSAYPAGLLAGCLRRLPWRVRMLDLPRQQGEAVGAGRGFALRLIANAMGQAGLRARHFGAAERACQPGLLHPGPTLTSHTGPRRREAHRSGASLGGNFASLREQIPELGRNVAIDGPDMPLRERPRLQGRPGARVVQRSGRLLGHRSAVSTRKSRGFYGYRLDMAVCTATDLPLAWNVRTARDNESIHALPLIDTARERRFAAETCAIDKRCGDRRSAGSPSLADQDTRAGSSPARP
jgi:hypothetical protein